MTTIKEILKNVKCTKCGNDDYKEFNLYFIMENRETRNYISCSKCNTLLELKFKNMKDYLLDPDINLGS